MIFAFKSLEHGMPELDTTFPVPVLHKLLIVLLQ